MWINFCCSSLFSACLFLILFADICFCFSLFHIFGWTNECVDVTHQCCFVCFRRVSTFSALKSNPISEFRIEFVSLNVLLWNETNSKFNDIIKTQMFSWQSWVASNKRRQERELNRHEIRLSSLTEIVSTFFLVNTENSNKFQPAKRAKKKTDVQRLGPDNQ